MCIPCLDNGGQEPNSVVNQRTVEATYLALASECIEFQTRRCRPTRRETGTAEGLIGASGAGDGRRLYLKLAGAKLRHANRRRGVHIFGAISRGSNGRDLHSAFFSIGLSLIFQVCATIPEHQPHHNRTRAGPIFSLLSTPFPLVFGSRRTQTDIDNLGPSIACGLSLLLWCVCGPFPFCT